MTSENNSDNKIRNRIAEAHRNFLLSFHKPLQKIIIFIVGPLSIALYAMGWFDNPTWHNGVLLGGVIAMFLSWLVAYLALRLGKLETSVMIFILSVIGFEAIELSLQVGSEATAVLGCFAVLAYATLYSKKYVTIASAATGLIIIFSEVGKYFRFWEIQQLEGLERVITQSAFAVLLIPVMVIVLRKRQSINDTLFSQVQDSAETQGNIITTANRVQPVINEVVGRIKGVSNSFVSQAAEQASATTEVTTTVNRLRSIADQSAEAAGNTRDIAERTRHESIESRDRLGSIQSGFKDVLTTMEESQVAIRQLSETADSVEEILNYNREIGEHIKVLAVNASLEAAKAGKYGQGFSVVAEELREMIVNTDDNLTKSSSLLDSIRSQAKDNEVMSSRSADALKTYFVELQSAGLQIENISESFVDTSKHVGLIADAAKEQQASISQVSTALAQIDTAAGQLEGAARVLLDGVGDIVESHEELSEVLARGEEGD